MENTIAAVTIVILTGASLQTVKAGDREGVTVGKILAGVAAGAVMAKALEYQTHTVFSRLFAMGRGPHHGIPATGLHHAPAGCKCGIRIDLLVPKPRSGPLESRFKKVG